MGQNDAFITFYTLLLGLGIATLLTRFADVLRRARLRDVGLVGLLLAILIVFEFLSGWAGAYRTFESVRVDIAALALPFATGACYFMASVLLLPEAGEVEPSDIDAYVSAQVPRIAFFLFMANVLLVGAEVPFVVARTSAEPRYLWSFYLPYNTSILLAYAAMMATRRRGLRIAAMLALILVYAWVTVTRAI